MSSNVKTLLIDFVVYIDTGSPVPNIPSKSRGLADENKKFLTGSVDSEELIKMSKFTVTPTTWMHKVIRIVHMTLLVR
jgi:hypothetical protein